jgi:preprotein translocase subunit YajC
LPAVPEKRPSERYVSSPILSNDLLLAQNVQPKATSPGTVSDSSPLSSSSGGSTQSTLAGFLPILMMLVIFVPFFLLMSRRQKKETAARASLKKGDRVVTNAGLVGQLVEIGDQLAKVKIAPSVEVQVLSNTVSPYVDPDKAQSKDLKEAKATSEKK